MKKMFALFILITFNISFAKSQCSDIVLKSIGQVSALYLYNTYGLIGSLADGLESSPNDSTSVRPLINEQISTLTSLKSTYSEMATNGGLAQNDQNFVYEIIDAYTLLIDEAKALNAYMKSPGTTEADFFQTKRKAAWAKIAAILGLE